MSEKKVLDEQFKNMIVLIDNLGKSGVAKDTASLASSTADFAGSVASSVANIASNATGAIRDVALEVIDIPKTFLETKQKQKEWEHEEKMQKMFLEKQGEIIKFATEASLKVYDKKMDFFAKRLENLEKTHCMEQQLLNERICYLETERKNCKDDIEIFTRLSSDIMYLEDKNSELEIHYLTAKANLDESVKSLKLELPSQLGDSLIERE